MELTNDELLKIAAMYIGAPVSFFNPVTKEWSKYRKLTPSGLQLIANGNMKWELLLCQLSTITNNHAIEVGKMSVNSDTRDYLISKLYAVPLWFGVNHWANGKTAFELGIAAEANYTVK
jgi:hypothetical protein